MPSTGASTSRLADLWHAGRPLLLIGLLMLLSVATNDAVIEYRMDEFNRAMESLSQKYNRSHSLNMLARFEMIRQRKDMPEEDEAALEMRLRALNAAPLLDSVQEGRRSLGDRAIAAAVAAVRFALGKPPQAAPVAQETRRELEVGYFYERARKYDRAVHAYSAVLEGGRLGAGTASTLLLHRGFCYSLLSEYARAEADFRRVIELDADADEAGTARRFLETLAALQRELRLAKAQAQSPLAYGRQLLNLANYTGALEELGKALSQPRLSAAERLEGLYLFARAQEEVGLDSEAVLTYQSVLRESPGSAYARKANRRLYLLGKLYVNDRDLEKKALQQLEQYQDLKFLDRLKSVAAAVPGRPAPPRPRWGELPGAAPPREEGLERLPEPGVAAALPGEAKPRGEEERPEVQKAALPPETRARQAKARRIQADPLRREAIVQVLAANKGELEFLYQKWLRKGSVFEGEIALRLLIAPTGEVREARVVAGKSTISHAGFIADVLQNARRWKFRGDPGATEDLPVTFPLKFVNKE